MKKINLLLLPLLALTMFGCSGTGGDSTQSSASASDAPISQKTSVDKTSSGSNKTSSSKKTSSIEKSSSGDEQGTVTSSSEEESASSSTVDVYSLGWSKKVVDSMLKYLGGNVIPYVNLGTSKYVEASWAVSTSDYGVLSIYGDTEWDDTTSKTSLTTVFAAAGWTTDATNADSSKYVATDPTGKVHVTISARSTSYYNADSTMVIKATYDEDYDLANSLGAWDSDTTQEFNDNLGYVAPYVYLATNYPSASFSSNTLTLSGGKWNDQILVDAATALNTAGFTCTTSGYILTATMTQTSGDVVDIVITKGGSSVSKVYMDVTVTEAYNPGSVSDWPQSVKNEMNTNLDGHLIPFLYMGCKTPTTYLYSYSTIELDIRGKGNITDDQYDAILLNSKTVFAADGWSVLEDESANSSYYSRNMCYIKTFSDGHQIKCRLKYSSSWGIYMECYISDGLVVPSTSTAWSADTTQKMKDNFNNYVLPYVYLNTANETATWDENSSSLVIAGGTWVSSICDQVNLAYRNLTDTNGDKIWTFSTTITSSYVKMTGEINGDKYTIEVDENSTSGNAEMTIEYVPTYSVPADCTDWSDTMKTDYFDTYLDGHYVPYVYLRRKDPAASDDVYWASYSNQLQITGGYWDEQMIVEAKKVYTEAAGWTLVSEKAPTSSAGGEYTVQKDYGDGCIVKVHLYEYSSYSHKTEMDITLTEYYCPEGAPTTWSQDTLTKLSNVGLDSTKIPYIYLGTKTESATSYYSSSTSNNYNAKVEIDGGSWNTKTLTAAETTLTTAGYTVHTYKNDSGEKTLIAYLKDTTTNTMITVYIYKYSESKTILYALTSNLGPITKTGSEAWDDSFKTSVQTYINDTTYMLPYISLGSGLTVTTETDYLQVKSTEKLSHERSLLIFDELTAAGWDANISMSGNDLKVTASYKTPSKGKIKLVIDHLGNVATMKLYYSEPFVAPEGVNSWSKAILSDMNTYFGHTLPYFYIGTTDPTSYYYSYSSYLTITGGAWDDEVYSNAIEALENDKDETTQKSYWTYMYDYSNSSYVTFVATREFEDGKHMTMKMYKYGYSSEQIRIEIYCR
jgi:hypothetical protein